MVLGDAICIGCCEIEHIRRWIAVGMQLLWPGERCVNEFDVAYAVGAAMIGEKLVMDGKDSV